MGRYDGNNWDSGLFTISDFKNRGVTKLAPDALVFISGNMGTSVLTPVSGKTQNVNFQDGITTINVQNNIDPPGSSTASIEIVTPIYNEQSNYWIKIKGDDGRTYSTPCFVPMMEVKVWFKGRFMVGGAPQYYPAFWGFIISVDESYSGGLYRITLNCADMLHWWTYVNVAYKPNPASNIFFKGKQGLTAFPSRYKRSNAFEIIYSLVNEMGYENFTPPDWLAKKTSLGVIFPNSLVENVFGGILQYWNKRFQGQGNLLRMYGAQGNLIIDPKNKETVLPENPQHQEYPGIDKTKGGSYSLVKEGYSIDDKSLKGFEVFMQFDKMGNLDTAEYLSKLEIATQIKSMVEYEFFQDVNGNFIFKPPFYNLNTKNLMPYRIKAQDILSYSSTINSDEIVTSLEVQSSIHQAIRDPSFVNNVGYHIDMDMVKRFGERFRRITVWWLSNSGVTRSAAVGHMSLLNAKAFTGNVTIPGRPELRMGYPVFIEHKDMFYYVRSINHTFDYGGSFTTTLSLEGARNRVYDEKTFQIQKDKIYKLTDAQLISALESNKKQQTKVAEAQTSQKTTISSSADQQRAIISNNQINVIQTDPEKKLEEVLRNSGYISSSIPGRYTITNRTLPEQVMLQSDTIPFTDDEGYKVVGGFRYGRGIVMKSGTVLDGATINAALYSSSERIQGQRQADVVTNMRTQADIESNYMADYFKIENTLGVESSIPSYLELINNATVPQTGAQQARVVTDMASGENTGSTVPLVGNPQNTGDINGVEKSINPGATDVSAYATGVSPQGLKKRTTNPNVTEDR